MKRVIYAFTLLASLLCISTLHAQGKNSVQEQTILSSLVDKYAESIEQANDTLKASKIWLHSDNVSFIHPRGHEQKWAGIKSIYKMFDDTFSTKKLVCYSKNINIYGDVALIEFYWTFDARFKKDDTPLQTKGRESQVWQKLNKDWKLVHVHYSGPPVTGAGQGF